VTDVELTYDVLGVAPDLEPILMLSDHPAYARFVDGTAVRVVLPAFPDKDDRPVPSEALDQSGSLLLPPGALAGLGVTAGALVGLRLAATGVELVRAEPSASAETIADLGRRAVAMLQALPEHPQSIEAVAYGLLADVPTAFVDPLPPLQELLAAWELPTAGDLVGVPGFDFVAWRVHRRVALLRQRHELSEDEALAVAAISRLHESVLEITDAYSTLEDSGDTTPLESVLEAIPTAGSEPREPRSGLTGRTVAATLPFLAEPAVAQAVLEETGFRDEAGAAALGLLVETLNRRTGCSTCSAVAAGQGPRGGRATLTANGSSATRAARWPPTVVDRPAPTIAMVPPPAWHCRVDEDAALAARRTRTTSALPVRTMPRNDPAEWVRPRISTAISTGSSAAVVGASGVALHKASPMSSPPHGGNSSMTWLYASNAESDGKPRADDDGHVVDVTLFETGALVTSSGTGRPLPAVSCCRRAVAAHERPSSR
jgi:hypothetical protein